MSGGSAGGIFKLIVNNGVQDKLLMATEYLSHRIKIITKRNRERAGDLDTSYLNLDASCLPDINAINKSHTIFTNGTFKPFVAAGFEYNRISAQGSIKYGSDVIFDIPTFGDYINDCVIHVKLSKLKTIEPCDRVRYVSMLGHRMFKKILFKVNTNTLDTYETEDYNIHYQFHVPPSKKIGWLRNVGQQIPHKALVTADPASDFHSEIKYFTDGNQTFKQEHDEVHLWIPLLFWFKDIYNSLPNAAIPFGQTKITASISEISDLIGFCDYGGGGKYIKPEIEVMELYMNNIFMNPDVINLIMSKFGFSLIRVHCRHSELLSKSSGSIRLNYLKWPTETLYTMFRPKNNTIYSQHWHKSATLIPCNVQVPVVARNRLNVIPAKVFSSKKELFTDNFIVIETNYASDGINDDNIYFEEDVDYNGYTLVITGGTGHIKNDKTLNTYKVKGLIESDAHPEFTFYYSIDKNSYCIPPKNIFSNKILGINIKGKWNSTYKPDNTTTFEFYMPELAINVATYYKEVPTIDSMSIIAHGITIFRDTHESFYNSYLPYRFGSTINTPDDRGMYMINFNFNPGDHQPSGHINLSRAREFYINYVSSYDLSSEKHKTELNIVSSAINFLLIKDGSAVLRYST